VGIRPGRRRNGTPLFIYHSTRRKFSGIWWEPRGYMSLPKQLIQIMMYVRE
jgi:hypothetical protein